MNKKFSLFTSLLTGFTLAVGTTINLPSHGQQNSTQFFCGNLNNQPATQVNSPRGTITVIRWNSDYFSGSGWTPQRRCEEVSKRFQEYYTKGELKFLTTGKMNNQSVVCVTYKEKANCTGLLFTLKPTSDPGRVLARLMAIRQGANNPLNETGKRIYINMDEFMATMPVEEGTTVNPQSDAVETGTQPDLVETTTQPNQVETNTQPNQVETDTQEYIW